MTQIPKTFKRILGNFFVLFVFLFISGAYYSFMSVFYGRGGVNIVLLIVGFHFFLLMLLWSLFQAMMTDPGVVPPLWGFRMGDSDQKRKRYCLMCHVFKPERCHHCSVCNRCVLGMDHHCPWVNNCIGFHNRKHFLLLLLYVIVCSTIMAISMASFAYNLVSTAVHSHQIPSYSDCFVLGIYFTVTTLAILMAFFFKFHLRLLFNNKTTIENIDKKNASSPSPYDRGWKINLLQVFGRNPWLWAIPLTGRSGKPIGDGVLWVSSQSASRSSVPQRSGLLQESEANHTYETMSSPKS